VAEKPKLLPYIDEMKKRISETLKLDESRISIKATTSEKLGFTGREEGIAAMAVATIYSKNNS
jgi:2-C-methyl-D-erythritol 2,4-cyclodiphosphate synthase